MPITLVHPKPAGPIEAMQWNATERRADELWEWTAKDGVIGDAWPTRFVVLGEDDSYAVLGGPDDAPGVGIVVADLIADGYSAAVRNPREGRWLPLRTGDWVLHHPDGQWSVIDDAGFVDTFEPAAVPTA